MQILNILDGGLQPVAPHKTGEFICDLILSVLTINATYKTI